MATVVLVYIMYEYSITNKDVLDVFCLMGCGCMVITKQYAIALAFVATRILTFRIVAGRTCPIIVLRVSVWLNCLTFVSCGIITRLVLFAICADMLNENRSECFCVLEQYCLPAQYNTSFLFKGAADRWREFHLNLLQCTNMRGPHFVGWRNLKLFSLQTRECENFTHSSQAIGRVANRQRCWRFCLQFWCGFIGGSL